ncbi:hypothetical protein PGT21_005439 [Puccinia graminis f. sp. tritici]|uniref:Uncharacterized protein n=1 Tax=Puccinia graminis f. sp. tritici TaxID=56615 RepID=A0A5B0QHJ7_PUCGR|nr:hypothetical protein PGTUg99_027310 [Puccinia graminis f. sp. tritici]KAA1112661.1 hypothetical protein PGT21_005439 [Puccinia graminis f. sp. tritici]
MFDYEKLDDLQTQLELQRILDDHKYSYDDHEWFCELSGLWNRPPSSTVYRHPWERPSPTLTQDSTRGFEVNDKDKPPHLSQDVNHYDKSLIFSAGQSGNQSKQLAEQFPQEDSGLEKASIPKASPTSALTKGLLSQFKPSDSVTRLPQVLDDIAKRTKQNKKDGKENAPGRESSEESLQSEQHSNETKDEYILSPEKAMDESGKEMIALSLPSKNNPQIELDGPDQGQLNQQLTKAKYTYQSPQKDSDSTESFFQNDSNKLETSLQSKSKIPEVKIQSTLPRRKSSMEANQYHQRSTETGNKLKVEPMDVDQNQKDMIISTEKNVNEPESNQIKSNYPKIEPTEWSPSEMALRPPAIPKDLKRKIAGDKGDSRRVSRKLLTGYSSEDIGQNHQLSSSALRAVKSEPVENENLTGREMTLLSSQIPQLAARIVKGRLRKGKGI